MNRQFNLFNQIAGILILLSMFFVSCSDTEANPEEAAGKITLEVSENTLNFLTNEKGELGLKVSSNVNWTARSSASWCTLSQESGKGDLEIIVSVTANPRMTSRTAEILISAGGNMRDTVDVIQFGKEVEYLLFIDGERLEGDMLYLDFAVNMMPLSVISNVDFSFSQDKESMNWAILGEIESTMALDKQRNYQLQVADNSANNTRLGHFIFQQQGGKYTDTIYFQQNAFAPQLRVNNNENIGSHFKTFDLMLISMGVDHWTLDFVDLESETPISRPSWITSEFEKIACTPFEYHVGDRYYLRATCEQNQSPIERKCGLRVSYEVAGKSYSQIIKITQLGWNGQASDSLVLMKLVERNAVPAYGLNVAWNLGTDILNWDKVICTKNEADGFYRITRLGLGESWLCYDLTGDIGNLSELKYLTLTKNYLSGPIPSTLKNCTKLEELQLFDNYNDELSYTPSAERSGITELPGEIFTSCPGLRHIDVSVNRIKSIPSELSFAVNLEHLDLGSNDVEAFYAKDFTGLGKLRYLHLGMLRKYRGPFFDFIFDIPSLEQIYFIRTNFDKNSLPDKWESLSNLEILNMANCNLTGALPVSLAQCKNLTQLLLENGDKYESAAPNNFVGTLPKEYGELLNLEVLSVANNNITGTIPESYANLFNLWNRTNQKFGTLDVSGNKMSGVIPMVILEHDAWSGLVKERTDKDGHLVTINIADLKPEIFICPQQTGYGFENCNEK